MSETVTQGILGLGISLFGCHTIPLDSFMLIYCHPRTQRIQRSQHILRISMTLLSGFLKPLCCRNQINVCGTPTIPIAFAEFALGTSVALFSGIVIQIDSFEKVAGISGSIFEPHAFPIQRISICRRGYLFNFSGLIAGRNCDINVFPC